MNRPKYSYNCLSHMHMGQTLVNILTSKELHFVQSNFNDADGPRAAAGQPMEARGKVVKFVANCG